MEEINSVLQQLAENEQKQKELYEKKALFEEQLDLWKQQRLLKRKLSLLRNEETAVLIENWQYAWDIGAPMPHIVSDGLNLFLIYYLALRKQQKEVSNPVALVSFEHAISHKFGSPNDEVIEGHPLYEHGMEAYKAHQVVHSSWIAELEKINSIHTGYYPEYWKTLKHYIFTFHDNMFECIAKGYTIEVFNTRFKEVVFTATERLFT
ncbi:hypothetical protein HYN56_04500 [Flavobacterium crocinum]|uniref:Uncharacterized protein n=1 Tax=Flavobacterium crocinum TaxID=2183896 RepID=A0A2S1YHK3_9FLAO|nr:hypothetical protein [Flavobacterium crocinum]AWK03521.1 hypothetical protein HYN56_04500 [Flavobacterium crocinum]